MSRNVLRCDPSPFHPSICRLSHYRMAFEVCNMFLQAVEPNITPQNRMHGLIVFGHEFVDAEIHRIALERNGVATARKTLPLLWDVVKVRRSYFHALILNNNHHLLCITDTLHQPPAEWRSSKAYRGNHWHVWSSEIDEVPDGTGALLRLEGQCAENGSLSHCTWAHIKN